MSIDEIRADVYRVLEIEESEVENNEEVILNWDSLSTVVTMGLIREKFGKTLDFCSISACQTIPELYNKIISKTE